MKKLVLVGIVFLVIAAAGVFVFHNISAQDSTAGSPAVSRATAEILQTKIDRIKKAEQETNKHHQTNVEVSDVELESYVLYSLRERIPIQLDNIDVQLTPGAVAADTQLTFNSNSTGNPMVDALVGGTHNLFVKGKLTGHDREGKFDLEEVRVDGIPVPRVLIQTLFDRYVKPKYPEADLKQPFELPWGIRSIDIQTGKAQIGY